MAVNAALTAAEKDLPTRSWIILGSFGVSLVAMVNKARKAKGATDPLVHADVIAGFATLVIAAVKVRRARRGRA